VPRQSRSLSRKKYEGRVAEIAPEAATAKGTLQVKVQIRNRTLSSRPPERPKWISKTLKRHETQPQIASRLLHEYSSRRKLAGDFDSSKTHTLAVKASAFPDKAFAIDFA